MNVSSIIVRTTPPHVNDVMESINGIDFCESHFHDAEGKIIVTIEGESIDEQMKRMKAIQDLPFVYSANLSFSYCEEELTEGLDKIMEATDAVPGKLKDS